MKEQLNQMHNEHAEWQLKIKDLKAQIQKCNDQLAEMVMTKPDAELLAQVEHFQNQFTIQRDVIDIMRHDFKQHENAIEAHQRGELNQFEKLNELHEKSKERLNEYNRIFSELKEEFSSFLQNNFANPV